MTRAEQCENKVKNFLVSKSGNLDLYNNFIKYLFDYRGKDLPQFSKIVVDAGRLKDTVTLSVRPADTEEGVSFWDELGLEFRNTYDEIPDSDIDLSKFKCMWDEDL